MATYFEETERLESLIDQAIEDGSSDEEFDRLNAQLDELRAGWRPGGSGPVASASVQPLIDEIPAELIDLEDEADRAQIALDRAAKAAATARNSATEVERRVAQRELDKQKDATDRLVTLASEARRDFQAERNWALIAIDRTERARKEELKAAQRELDAAMSKITPVAVQRDSFGRETGVDPSKVPFEELEAAKVLYERVKAARVAAAQPVTLADRDYWRAHYVAEGNKELERRQKEMDASR